MAKNKKTYQAKEKNQELQERYEEIHYFRRHAHEDGNSELPFPYLVL